MSAIVPPRRRKLHSETKIGLPRARVPAPVPPPRAAEQTLVGGLDAHLRERPAAPPAIEATQAPEPAQPPAWLPAWRSSTSSSASSIEDSREDEWCSDLRSPSLESTPLASPPEQLSPPVPVAPVAVPAAPPLPGGRAPSADDVFVATVPPAGDRPRAPMLALLVAGILSVAGMAAAAIVTSSDEGPVWRLSSSLAPEIDIPDEPAADSAETLVEPPAPASPPPKAEVPTGTLVLDPGSAPCDMWIDGVGRHIAGRTALRVSAGPHAVACRRGGKLAGRRVVVPAGKSAVVRFR